MNVSHNSRRNHPGPNELEADFLGATPWGWGVKTALQFVNRTVAAYSFGPSYLDRHSICLTIRFARWRFWFLRSSMIDWLNWTASR